MSMQLARFFMVVGVFIATSVSAADKGDGYALMQRSDAATKSQTEVASYQLDLLDASGKLVQSRDMLFNFKRNADKESTLVRFLAPPAISGTGLLVQDGDSAVNDIWLYLPATRRLRRIAGGEKSNWFMGTEFAHEDFEDYQLPLYRFTLVGADSCESGPCTKVRAEATDEGEREASGYQAKIYYIDDQTLYPVRIDYLGKQGQIVKVFTATGLKQQGRYWRPSQIEMANQANGRRTRMTAQQRELDGPLSDYKVSQRYLRTE